MCAPNIMLPSIRLIVGAILATIVAAMTSFWCVTTFQIAKSSMDVPPHGAPPLDSALSDRLERKQIYNLTGTRRGNEQSLAFNLPRTNGRVPDAARPGHEESVIEMPANNVDATSAVTSPGAFQDADQASSIAVLPERTQGSAPAVLTEDVATLIESLRTDADTGTSSTASTHEPRGMANGAEAPTNRNDERAIRAGSDAAISAIPSTMAGAIRAAESLNRGDTAETSGTSHIMQSQTAAAPPEPIVIASPHTTTEMNAAASTSSIAEAGTASNPSSEAIRATITPNPNSAKATAAKRKHATNAARPQAQVKKAKGRQVTRSKGTIRTAVHLPRHRVRPATHSAAQPQTPANPFRTFFGSQ